MSKIFDCINCDFFFFSAKSKPHLLFTIGNQTIGKRGQITSNDIVDRLGCLNINSYLMSQTTRATIFNHSLDQ